MTARDHTNLQMLGLSAKPAWSQTWHLWTVMIPRRSITGRLVFGKVWRRHDGSHWIYSLNTANCDKLATAQGC